MPQNWLKVEHKFIGQARRNGVWGPALIILKQDLAVLAYLPFLKKDNDEAIPHIVEAHTAVQDNLIF